MKAILVRLIDRAQLQTCISLVFKTKTELGCDQTCDRYMYATLHSYWRHRPCYTQIMTVETLRVASHSAGGDAHVPPLHNGGAENGHECTGPQVRDPVQPLDNAEVAEIAEVALRNTTSCESEVGSTDKGSSSPGIDTVADGDVVTVCKKDSNSVKDKPSSEGESAGRKHQGVYPRINIDLDIILSMRRHPFKALLASPLLLLAASSLAVFTVSAVLCGAFIGPGVDEKKHSVTQEEQPELRVTTLEPEESTMT